MRCARRKAAGRPRAGSCGWTSTTRRGPAASPSSSTPQQQAAYLNLGALLGDAGRYGELASLCDEALARCPPSALLHFNRGVALDHLERLAAAAASYERALSLDPTLADAHYNLARVREELGDPRAALQHFSAYRRLQR